MCSLCSVATGVCVLRSVVSVLSAFYLHHYTTVCSHNGCKTFLRLEVRSQLEREAEKGFHNLYTQCHVDLYVLTLIRGYTPFSGGLLLIFTS